MRKNNVLQAVGTLWRRDTSIPMGGPVSAQSADLHTLWRTFAYTFGDWGTFSVSEEGYLVWQRGLVWFSLCQFGDNILCASNIRPSQTTNIIQMICNTLSKIWDLEVLCACVDGGAAVYEGQRLLKTAQALGISLTDGGGCRTEHNPP